MDVREQFVCTYIISTDSQFDVTRELAFVGLLVFSLQFLHVFCNMLAEDVLTVNGSVEGLAFGIISGEALDGVGDVEATVDSAFHGTENTSSSGCAGKSNVQVATEGAGAIIDWLNEVFFAGDVSAAAVEAVKPELVEDATGNQQTGAVSGSVVGQAALDSVLGQLMRVSGAHDAISLNASVSDLTGDVAVAEAHDQTVLGSVVLVLILEDKTLASLVVGSALTTPLELDLVALEVLFVLHDLNETHLGYFVCS